MASNAESVMCEWDGHDICFEPHCECTNPGCWHRGIRPALTARTDELDHEIEVVKLVMEAPVLT